MTAGEKDQNVSLFRLVWRGWFVSVTVIFVPLYLVSHLIGIGGGDSVSGVSSLVIVVLIPIIAALQGVVVGALVVLGNKIKPIK